MEHLEEPIYYAKAHSQIINAVDGVGGLGIGAGAPEIITGSRDGIMLKFLLKFMLKFYEFDVEMS